MKKRGRLKISHYNFFPKNREGQFYLVAAIIILAIAIGVASVSNYIGEGDLIKINSVKQELEIEGEKVLDYKATSGVDRMDAFLDNYTEYAMGEGREFYFITGQVGGLQGKKYSENGEESLSVVSDGSSASFSVGEDTYEFNLNSGDNFYFVIIQKSGGEKYVARN